MKVITVSHWINPDMRNLRSYASSYQLRHGSIPLFDLHLHKQLGFYQISEFVAASPTLGNFIIEQTNRLGPAKIAAFDKASGNMLGVLKGNQLLGSNEEPVVDIERVATLNELLCPLGSSGNEDYAAVTASPRDVAALFYSMPRKSEHSWAWRAGLWLRSLSSAPQTVMELSLCGPLPCDLRMICAVAVVLHSRSGLQLKQ